MDSDSVDGRVGVVKCDQSKIPNPWQVRSFQECCQQQFHCVLLYQQMHCCRGKTCTIKFIERTIARVVQVFLRRIQLRLDDLITGLQRKKITTTIANHSVEITKSHSHNTLEKSFVKFYLHSFCKEFFAISRNGSFFSTN